MPCWPAGSAGRCRSRSSPPRSCIHRCAALAAADARIVVFSATAANSTSAELPELGHGVFTYSVLEGLRGAANTGGDGVRLLGLADYIYREVTKLTNAQQKPFYYISSMENILLARP